MKGVNFMKRLKIIALSIICFLLNLQIISADESDYKKIYMNYIKSINNEEVKILFYDIDKNNIHEMILYKYTIIKDKNNINKSVFNNIYEIYTINNGHIEKLFNIENETITNQQASISFFITNNNELCYGVQDKNFYSNTNYYKLNCFNGKITSEFIGKVENNLFKQINFNQTIHFIDINNIKDIEFSLNNVNNIPANPTIEFNTHTRQVKPNSNYIGINTIKYNNGMYDYFSLNTTKDLLMINGNMLPKINIIKENNQIFLPLRIVCNYFNKPIYYNNYNNTIKVDSVTINLSKKQIEERNETLNIINLNGNIHLPLEFFNSNLKLVISNLKVDNINIIALEKNHIPNNKIKASDEVKSILAENIKQNNNQGIYQFKNMSKKQDLGRYYVFEIDYIYTLYNNETRKQVILYDKYTDKIYNYSGGIKYYNNKIILN